MKKILNKIIDFLFPAQCSGCQEYGAFFCKKCINNLKKRKNIEIKSNNLEKIYAIYEYKNNKNLKKIVKNIKYKNLFSEISEITNILGKIIIEKFGNKKVILIPVPLHFLRKFKRGFNQSEKIIEEILLRNKSLKTKNLLKRIKNTPHQASLDKKGRLLNLKNAFEINYFEKIDSKIPFILIDDICTTGETLENCAIELKKYYKNPIYGLVIASDKF